MSGRPQPGGAHQVESARAIAASTADVAVDRRSLTVWRHPRPCGAAGRCIGRTDLAVDPRKAKRLAHRIRAHARREGLPRCVVTSPLERAAAVGRWLRRWGFRHRVDPRLAELDFGDWDGRHWDEIGADRVGAWTDAFATHAPGRGESVAALLGRCAAVLAAPGTALAVGHAGWISAACWLAADAQAAPTAAEWPAAIGYGYRCSLSSESGRWRTSPATR